MLPVQITVRDIPATEVIETQIRKRAEKLNRFFDRISSCRVVVDLAKNHPHQGKLYNVRIDITVPGKEFVATKNSDQDVYIAIRDAFNAIERQIEEHAQKRQGQIKTHENSMHGYIVRIFPNEGYGFIEGIDGNEYYFSITNVSHQKFDQLTIGDAVLYTAILSSEGRQAHHVIKQT